VTIIEFKDCESYLCPGCGHRLTVRPCVACAVSRRAMVGDKARDVYDKRAKERQKLSEGRGKKGMVTVPHLKARDDAGKAVGVSGSLIDRARIVREEGEGTNGSGQRC
jgi:hypothetical protein